MSGTCNDCCRSCCCCKARCSRRFCNCCSCWCCHRRWQWCCHRRWFACTCKCCIWPAFDQESLCMLWVIVNNYTCWKHVYNNVARFMCAKDASMESARLVCLWLWPTPLQDHCYRNGTRLPGVVIAHNPTQSLVRWGDCWVTLQLFFLLLEP